VPNCSRVNFGREEGIPLSKFPIGNLGTVEGTHDHSVER
jgi:hypothetical protein